MNSSLKVSVGILARNEAAHVGDLIDDLARKTLPRAEGIAATVYLVANGCTDDTARIARDAFNRSAFGRAGWKWEVHELNRPGKSNAWNEFVHRIAPDDTDYAFFLDGDIRVPSESAIEVVMSRLHRHPTAVVAVDRSVKDLENEAAVGLSERLIKAATGTANDTRTAIAGAFYCVRFSEIRDLWLPIGLPGEDGFLRAMLLTSGFDRPEQLERHLYVEDAYHVFESLRTAGSVVRHNVRLAIGTAVNILLFKHLRALRTEGVDIRSYIRRQNEADPDWINALIKKHLETSRYPLEPRFVTRRLRRLWHAGRLPTPRSAAIALLGFALDVLVFVKATVLMRRGAGAGYW